MSGANLLFFAALICMVAVLGSFLLGMVAMTREGEKNRDRSNKMMRFRVLFQGLALLFLLLAYLARQPS
ncbi:MAG TPA: twin transmembrane helix small protein [Patescibacteria group bacterium]|nr:twin transmembrane helix small protein [Patescibacteria group bacterium]